MINFSISVMSVVILGTVVSNKKGKKKKSPFPFYIFSRDDQATLLVATYANELEYQSVPRSLPIKILSI